MGTAETNPVQVVDEESPVDDDARLVVKSYEGVRGLTQVQQCRWTLHASLPYVEDDTQLSHELLFPIALKLKRGGIEACRVIVKDGHIGEREPHYQLYSFFGYEDDLTNSKNEITLRMDYSSVDEGESADGFIEIAVLLPEDSDADIIDLLDYVFIQYDLMMDKYYSTTVIEYTNCVYQ